jgi:hypothetical protein
LGFDLDGLKFPAELTAEFLKRTERFFKPVPDVRIASLVGACHRHCHWAMSLLMLWKVGEGDGLVPAESQKWGDFIGEFDLDHVSEVGVDSDKKDERRRMLEALSEKIQDWWPAVPRQ